MKREEKRQEKRAAILEAARAEFEGQRFDSVKLDDIAARAGVGKGTLYLYFKNKEDLFLQLAVDGMDEMAARVDEVGALDQPYKERFFLLGSELVAFFQHRATMNRLLHQKGSDEIFRKFQVHREVMTNALHRFLERGVVEGTLRTDVEIKDLHMVLVGPLLLRGWIVKKVGEVSSDAALKIIWDGIKK